MLRRYERAELSEVAVAPTEEEMWPEGNSTKADEGIRGVQ